MPFYCMNTGPKDNNEKFKSNKKKFKKIDCHVMSFFRKCRERRFQKISIIKFFIEKYLQSNKLY